MVGMSQRLWKLLGGDEKRQCDSFKPCSHRNMSKKCINLQMAGAESCRGWLPVPESLAVGRAGCG